MTQDTIHATCVAIDGRGILLSGPSGSGKSDLALRLIDRGAVLVSDDYTVCCADGSVVVASPPATIAGRIEVRGIGIVEMGHLPQVTVALLIHLDGTVERMPDPATRLVAGTAIPLLRLAAFEASAPLKVALALAQVSA